LDAGLTATDWVAHIATPLNGKSGGKEAQATATGDQVDKLDEIMEMARVFALTKIK
jgi:alanyl-tRNA synthetase